MQEAKQNLNVSPPAALGVMIRIYQLGITPVKIAGDINIHISNSLYSLNEIYHERVINERTDKQY